MVPPEILYQTIINRAVRAPIPSFNCADAGSFAASVRTAPASNCIAARPRYRTPSAPRHGMGNREHSSSERRPARKSSSAISQPKAQVLHHAAEVMLDAFVPIWEVWKKKGYL